MMSDGIGSGVLFFKRCVVFLLSDFGSAWLVTRVVFSL